MISSLNFMKSLNSRAVLLSNFCRNSSASVLHYEKDPGSVFINPDVQKLLKNLTNPSIDVVFSKRTVPDNSVSYKFMTTEELQKEYQSIVRQSEEVLQMPPVVKIREESPKLISKDTALAAFSDTKYVITDITYGLKYSQRKVVVRNTDGTLEYASDDIAKRMKQTYIPDKGRKVRKPKIFQDEKLFAQALEQGSFKFILDRLCIQYEPFEKEYHELSSKVYSEVDEKKAFDSLRSTRHFGPLVFFLAWHKKIDNLLCDLIERDLLRNAVDLVALMSKLHNIEVDQSILGQLGTETNPSNRLLKQLQDSIEKRNHETDNVAKLNKAIGKTLDDFPVDEAILQFIETFTKNNSLKKIQVAGAIQTLREQNQEKKQLLESLKKSQAQA
ncbi:MRPS22 family protein [Megaselia abdita]